MGLGGMIARIAESTELKATDVERVFFALWTNAYAEVKKGRSVVIGPMELKLKHKPARKAGKNIMFGKEVLVAKQHKRARKAGTKVFAKALNSPADTLPDDTL